MATRKTHNHRNPRSNIRTESLSYSFSTVARLLTTPPASLRSSDLKNAKPVPDSHACQSVPRKATGELALVRFKEREASPGQSRMPVGSAQSHRRACARPLQRTRSQSRTVTHASRFRAKPPASLRSSDLKNAKPVPDSHACQSVPRKTSGELALVRFKEREVSPGSFLKRQPIQCKNPAA
jgi:hypothetical protein